MTVNQYQYAATAKDPWGFGRDEIDFDQCLHCLKKWMESEYQSIVYYRWEIDIWNRILDPLDDRPCTMQSLPQKEWYVKVIGPNGLTETASSHWTEEEAEDAAALLVVPTEVRYVP